MSGEQTRAPGAPKYQEHLRLYENHKELSTDEEVEAEFAGHEELIEEFKRRLSTGEAQRRCRK